MLYACWHLPRLTHPQRDSICEVSLQAPLHSALLPFANENQEHQERELVQVCRFTRIGGQTESFLHADLIHIPRSISAAASMRSSSST